MPETIRYARIGEEDINFGTGTFEVRLADGRVVVLQQVDIGVILSDATISTRDVTLDTLTVTTLTVTTVNPPTTLRIPEKADPGSPGSGEVWINSGGLVVEYADDAATPAKHTLVAEDTTQTLTGKTLTAPVIATIVNTGTLTLPTTTDTLVGRATTDTLTNKTLTTPAITTPTITSGGTWSGPTLTNPRISGAAPATPTADTLYTDSIVKGWVKFQVNGTIDDDLNVSSITDNGAGDWTINWATSFANTTYVVIGLASGGVQGTPSVGLVFMPEAPAAASARVHTYAATSMSAADPDTTIPATENKLYACAIGDQ